MRTPVALLAAATVLVAAAPAAASPVVRSTSGANAAGIQSAVDQFRADLGTLNANTTVVNATGRREINWDGVPDAFAAPNALPGNFFNSNSPRGVVLSTPGSSLQVSAVATSPPIEFGNVSATYPTAFAAFSPQRLFTAIGSNVTDVTFFLPGTTVPATTSGFGAVFTDVDRGVTSIQYFDAVGNDLGKYLVPPKPAGANDASLSFVGVNFSSE